MEQDAAPPSSVTCLRCRRRKGFFSLNYAGMTILGVKYPGDPEAEYLCLRCQQALHPELKEQQKQEHDRRLKEDGGVQKPRERLYAGLNVPLEAVAQEVESYLTVNGFSGVDVKKEGERTIIAGGDLAVVVSGSPDSIKVAAGPREILLDPSTALGLTLVASPLFAIAKGIGVAWDKYKVDKFFAHLDRVLYARSASGSPAQEQAGDVANRLRELAKLRDDGLLSDDEFQAKKRELISRL